MGAGATLASRGTRRGAATVALLALAGLTVSCATPKAHSSEDDAAKALPLHSRSAAPAEALVRLVQDEPFGANWADGAGRDSSSCREFLGDGFRFGPAGYWVYAWSGSLAGGSLDRFAYLVGESDSPTLERMAWALPKGGEADSTVVESTYVAITRAFDRTFEQLKPDNGSVMTGGSAYWAESRLYATPRGLLRINRMAPKFAMMSASSIRLEYWSTPLCAEATPAWAAESPVYELTCGSLPTDSLAAQAGTLDALRPRFAHLREALSKDPGDLADLPIAVDALRSAAGLETEESKDLIFWSVHVWLRSLPDSARDALEGGRVLDGLLGTSWNRCMNDSLAYRLADRAGSNRWTDAAFVELMTTGWGCYGGEGVDVPDTNESWVDTSAPVIERGERFLATHPGSSIWSDVAWRTAMAHETTWTLFKSSEPYVRSLGQLRNKAEIAHGHRDRAMQLYEMLIAEEPSSARSRAAAKRVRRMRLDVATDFRMYCDFLD